MKRDSQPPLSAEREPGAHSRHAHPATGIAIGDAAAHAAHPAPRNDLAVMPEGRVPTRKIRVLGALLCSACANLAGSFALIGRSGAWTADN